MLIDATENWVGGEVNLGADVAEDYFEKSVKPLFAVNPRRNNDSERPSFFGVLGESTEAYCDYRRMKCW